MPCARPDAHFGADRNIVKERKSRKLRRYELDRIPTRDHLTRNAHRRDEAMAADLVEAMLRELVDAHHVRLFNRAVRVRVQPLIHVGAVRLRVVKLPSDHVVEVNAKPVAFHDRRELRECLVVVVHAHA